MKHWVPAGAMKTSGAMLAASLLGLVQPASAQTDPGAIDLSDRETARTWHNTWWPKSHGAPMGFTGDASTGTPGDISQAYRDQTVLRINIFRRMAGLQPVTADPEYNRLCQAAAVLMSANGKISHNPDPTWKFYTPDALKGAQNSSLALGATGPAAAYGYLIDPGFDNLSAAHRHMMLEPGLRILGIGDAAQTSSLPSVNAQGVGFDIEQYTREPQFLPSYISWPPPGYIPHHLLPGRWSIRVADWFEPTVTFRDATVVVWRNGIPLQFEGTGAQNGGGMIWTLDGTVEGGVNSWFELEGESLYGLPPGSSDNYYHIVINNVRRTSDGSLINGNGRIAYDVIAYDPKIPTRAPIVGTDPQAVAVTHGRSTTLSVSSKEAVGYQWFKGSEPLEGASHTSLTLNSVEYSDAGEYWCRILGESGTCDSRRATITVTNPENSPPARLVNISTRSFVGTGDEVLIAGFVIGGNSEKRILLRAAGPSLAQFNVPNVLQDPILQVFDKDGVQIGVNDDWDSQTKSATPSIAWWFADGSRDAAILMTLSPGAYTAKVAGKSGATGIALVEAYELLQTDAQLVNLSSRSLVKTNDEVQIAGFVISGSSSKQVLIRASGPALRQFGITAALPDPVLQVFDSGARILATNDNWEQSTKDRSSSVYWWFDLRSNDAAVILELPPGSYTAKVSGKDNSVGVSLVELYELPE